MTEPTVLFNMDLANGPTAARFCYEAADVLDLEINPDDQSILDDRNDFEAISEICDEWTTNLENNGFLVRWDAGDVIVYDMRPLTSEQREEFNKEMEGI